MAAPITTIKPRGIDVSGDYVVNSISSTGNVSAGNIKTDHLLYANGTAYVFNTNAAGTNTQLQFNDGNSFAGDANLTFNKTTGTLTVAQISGNGSSLTSVNAVTLNGHSDTYFATSTQGSLADTAVQPGDLATVATTGSYTDLIDKPTLFDGEYISLANKPTLFSGSYTDLSNKPTLGTAASTDATAYATAAQGAKADTALQAANLSGYATESYVGNSIANLVASAPAALDTLNELAIALGNDASYSTTINNALANKLSTSNFASTANTWISTQSTSNLTEGTNLYYTVTRANTAIDARVTKTFVDNLAVVANIANIAYSVSGSNVSGPVAYAAIANSVSGSNVVGQVANALVAGTVYTADQPNITSVGTLTSLTVTGNANVGTLNVSSGTFVTGNGTGGNISGVNEITANFFIGNGSQLTGLPAGYTNTDANAAIDARVTKTFVDNLSVNANTLNGHSDTYFATSTQGAKADTALQPANLVGYATESYVGNAVANLVASAPAALDTLNELAIALGNDASYSTTITNALANKLSTSNFTSTANTWISTQTTSNLTEGTNLYYTETRANSAIDARVTKTFVDNLAVVANIANTAYSVSGSNVSGPVAYAAIANSVSGSNVVGEVAYAAVANSVSGANVSGVVANATVSGTVYTNAQPNITSVGTLTSLLVTGNITGNYIIGNGSQLTGLPAGYTDSNVESYLPTYTGNLSPGNITISSDNLKLTGGTANYVLSTDGTGNLSWAAQASGGTSGGESTITSVDTFTGDGTETVFTLSVTPQSINQTFINYNGALQLRSAYTISGQDITFSEAPANGSLIEVTTQMGVTSGSGNLTVRNYTADGVQTDYTVSAGVNATNILVTENGLVQTPTTDYTVTGSTLTFTTAPGYNVKIQIRELGVAVATITPVGSNTQVLFNDGGSFGNSAQFTFNKTSNTLSVNNISVTGNIVPTANVTYNLGNSTNRFKDLFLSGNTIDLGGAQIKTDVTSGAIAFVPPATVAEPNPTALVISSTGGISTATTTNGVLTANAINVAAATGTLSSPRYITMHTTGNISASTGTSRYYPPGNVNINNVSASLSTAPTANMTFQLCKNGSNVAAFTISANSYTLTKTSANIMLSTSDYLTVNIVSGDGNDLRMDLQYVAA